MCCVLCLVCVCVCVSLSLSLTHSHSLSLSMCACVSLVRMRMIYWIASFQFPTPTPTLDPLTPKLFEPQTPNRNHSSQHNFTRLYAATTHSADTVLRELLGRALLSEIGARSQARPASSAAIASLVCVPLFPPSSPAPRLVFGTPSSPACCEALSGRVSFRFGLVADGRVVCRISEPHIG